MAPDWKKGNKDIVLTIFGDMNNKKSFFIAQGDTLVVWGQRR